MKANRLRELRLKEKLTQKEIAEIIGITQRAYQNYERGRRTPSLETAQKLSNIFMVSIEEIFFTKSHCKMQCNEKTSA